MDNAKHLSAIRDKLDQLAIAYLEKLEEYTQEWQLTGELMQKGFLDLAHAKYTMGSDRISHYSYDGRMKAQLQILIDEDNAHAPFLINNESILQEKHVSDTDSEKCPQPGLRRRLVNTLENEDDSDSSEWSRNDEPDTTVEDNTYEMNEKKPVKPKLKSKAGDPLQWFGLLVSPSLRTSQEHFQKATTQLINQVNRIHELNLLEEQYHNLEKKKLELMSKQTLIKEDNGD